MYLKRSIETYAHEHVKAGNWDPAEALQKSEKEFLQLLPEGVASPHQHLFSLEDSQTGAKVGWIWFTEKQQAAHPAAFIYDFLIYDEYRQQGYGKQALIGLEEKAKELGLETISLHVFGHNKIAIHLYQATGYEISDLLMA